jgi:hypothetical protein
MKTMKTSPSLIPSKDQLLLSLMGYLASMMVVPMVKPRRQEHRLGTASRSNEISSFQEQTLGNYFRGLPAYKRKGFLLREYESK